MIFTVCNKEGCKDVGEDTHHLTYIPPMTRELCHKHHVEITDINRRKAFQLRRKLTNNERLQIWLDWNNNKYDVFNGQSWIH